MHRSIQSARVIQVIAGLALLVMCQVAAAQSTPVEPGVPQWVIDRQQYETTFVLPQTGDVQLTEVVSGVPQWVIDRQQYQTTYVPSPLGDLQPIQLVLQASG
jgi:hypothetical protein